jgi:uncharacterized membrane protein
MTENASEGPVLPQSTPAAGQSSLRGLVLLCYVLFLLGLFNGLTAVAGVIIAYVKKRDAAGTVWQSHFDSLILIFWVALAFFTLMLISLPVSFVSLALWVTGDFVWPAFSSFAFPVLLWMLVGPVLLIWFLYRIIRGLIRASEDRPY